MPPKLRLLESIVSTTPILLFFTYFQISHEFLQPFFLYLWLSYTFIIYHYKIRLGSLISS
nr:MAG TPA: hypothetical protein [Caudoviricetes sp.]